jgi:transcriptional regulator NrdR family protein
MAKQVVKKDGKKEVFSSEKIMDSISSAADETELSDDMKNQIVEEVSGMVIDFANSKKTITTKEIREKILSELDSREPAVSAAWRAYDEGKK